MISGKCCFIGIGKMLKEKEIETENERTLTPQEVRNILKTDNREIVELCKKASIRPRKNEKGYTYFSYDEVKNLRKVQAKINGTTDAAVSGSNAVTVTSGPVNPAVKSILNSLQDLENKLSEKISKVIDEKLEGMDDVVVELIRCKTDNETLKQKIVDLNKEIYQLKNEVNSYKSVGFGLYRKKEIYIWE